MRKFSLLCGVLALAGCAYPNPAHVASLNALVGKTETDLIRAQGVPNRTYSAGGHKFLAFSRNRIETIPGSPGFGPGFGGWGYGYGWGGPYWGGGFGGFGPDIVQRDCETTFELDGGVVKTWSLRGNDC